MLIPELFGFELLLVLFLIEVFEDILEATIVFLEDCVFGAHVQRIIPIKCVSKARMGKRGDRCVSVVHAHHDASALEVENFHFNGLLCRVFGLESHHKLSRLSGDVVSCPVLVTESMASNDDRLSPAGHQSRDVLNDNRLSEDSAIEFVSDCTVGGLPHELQLEFFDSGFVWGNRSALDSHFVFFDGLSGLKSHFVVSFVPVLHTEIEVLNVDIEVGSDQLVLDVLPDDARHLVAVHLHDGFVYLDLLKRLHLNNYYAAPGKH